MPSATGTRSSRSDAPDVVAIAAQLRLSATRLARQLRQQSEGGLTPSQLSALSAIHVHGPITLGSLAEYERVAPPSVTKVVTKLEAAGLVRRTADASDRRVARVTTTAEGERLLGRIRQRKNAWLAARLGELEPGELARLHDALDVLDALTREQR